MGVVVHEETLATRCHQVVPGVKTKLYEEIGRLKIELDWLKKSALDLWITFPNASIT